MIEQSLFMQNTFSSQNGHSLYRSTYLVVKSAQLWRKSRLTYPKVLEKWCLDKLMELFIEHIIYALNGFVVTQRGLDGPSRLPYDAQDSCRRGDKRVRYAPSSRKMRSAQVRAQGRAGLDLSEPRYPRGTMDLTRVRK